MDIVFAVATSNTELCASPETAALLFLDAGQKRIAVPIFHDKADSLEEQESMLFLIRAGNFIQKRKLRFLIALAKNLR